MIYVLGRFCSKKIEKLHFKVCQDFLAHSVLLHTQRGSTHRSSAYPIKSITVFQLLLSVHHCHIAFTCHNYTPIFACRNSKTL